MPARSRALAASDAATDELVREEMIADAVGDQFLKPSFWQRVMERAEPGVGQRIATMLRNFMDRVIEWLGQRGFGSSRYVGDMQRFRDAEVGAVFGLGFAPNAGGPLAFMQRRGLPERCSKQWFSTTFCGGKVAERTAEESIWDAVVSFNMYDPIALLATVPRLRELVSHRDAALADASMHDSV